MIEKKMQIYKLHLSFITFCGVFKDSLSGLFLVLLSDILIELDLHNC